MSLIDVTRELNRTRDAHVFIVLADFFAGNPPQDELRRVTELIVQQGALFTSLKPAPDEPKNE